MRVQLHGDLRGWRGTARTVREMARLVKEGKADPTVIFLAEQLARKRNKRDYLGQLREIFNWIRKNIHYVRDPRDVEFIRSPLYTMHYKAGDCDDQAILFSALAEGIGFKSRLKTIKANPLSPSEFSHIYAQAFVPGHGWVTADTIVDYATLGWEASRQFGSQAWEDGVGVMGELAPAEGRGVAEMFGLGSFGQGPISIDVPGRAVPYDAGDEKKEPNFWDKMGNVLGNIAIGTANILGNVAIQDLSQNMDIPTAQQQQARRAAAPATGLPGWLIPAGFVLAAAGVGGFVFMRKHR